MRIVQQCLLLTVCKIVFNFLLRNSSCHNTVCYHRKMKKKSINNIDILKYGFLSVVFFIYFETR